MTKPLIAITMGDPAGVGPETIIGAWNDPAVHDNCRAVVLGNVDVMRQAASLLGGSHRVVEVATPEEVDRYTDVIPCLSCCRDEVTDVRPGTVDVRGGQAAYDALVTAADFAMSGRVDALVTAPLNKSALWAAGHRYPGHTELLAEICGVSDFAMMLYLAPGPMIVGRIGLGVVHTTLHVALRDVFDRLTTDNIVAKAHLANAFGRSLLTEVFDQQPRVGVCALNPHAGEQGLFGDEEQRIILPAVERARAEGLSVTGPLPCDTLMMRAAAGEFDTVVAMYHDQGHIALKLLGMHRAVNVTLGLPIVRTSVAHGTAFDLAWQGCAESSGMVEAVKMAATLARHRVAARQTAVPSVS